METGNNHNTYNHIWHLHFLFEYVEYDKDNTLIYVDLTLRTQISSYLSDIILCTSIKRFSVITVYFKRITFGCILFRVFGGKQLPLILMYIATCKCHTRV